MGPELNGVKRFIKKVRSLILILRLKRSRRSILLDTTGQTTSAIPLENIPNPVTPSGFKRSPGGMNALTKTGTRFRQVQNIISDHPESQNNNNSQSSQVRLLEVQLWQPASSPLRYVQFTDEELKPAIITGPEAKQIPLTSERIKSWLAEKRQNWPSQQSVMKMTATDAAKAIGLNVGTHRFEWGHIVAFMFGGQNGLNPQNENNFLSMSYEANSEMLGIFESPVCQFILEHPEHTFYMDVSTKKYANSHVGHSVTMRIYLNPNQPGVTVSVNCLTLRKPDDTYIASMKKTLEKVLFPQTNNNNNNNNNLPTSARRVVKSMFN